MFSVLLLQYGLSGSAGVCGFSRKPLTLSQKINGRG